MITIVNYIRFYSILIISLVFMLLSSCTKNNTKKYEFELISPNCNNYFSSDRVLKYLLKVKNNTDIPMELTSYTLASSFDYHLCDVDFSEKDFEKKRTDYCYTDEFTTNVKIQPKSSGSLTILDYKTYYPCMFNYPINIEGSNLKLPEIICQCFDVKRSKMPNPFSNCIPSLQFSFDSLKNSFLCDNGKPIIYSNYWRSIITVTSDVFKYTFLLCGKVVHAPYSFSGQDISFLTIGEYDEEMIFWKHMLNRNNEVQQIEDDLLSFSSSFEKLSFNYKDIYKATRDSVNNDKCWKNSQNLIPSGPSAKDFYKLQHKLFIINPNFKITIFE